MDSTERWEVALKTAEFKFPNAIAFISDVNGGTAPYPTWGALVQSTPSCISVACTPGSEGPTTVTVGFGDGVDPGGTPAFQGTLDTPSGTLVVTTVDRRIVVSFEVARTTTRVRIWVNDPSVPDRVVIGVQ
ncbi:MAG TPA: hypothetical protein VE686_04500 [Beijerinckiaceae bacterium]|nr:hypothetical protein [Beijerinckiaceae bacterium]